MTAMPNDEVMDKMESLLNIAADSTRLKILFSLTEGEKNVSEIIEEVGASQSLISHQLKLLRQNDLVSTRKEGTKVYYSLDDEHINKLLDVVLEHAEEKVL